MIYLDNNATTAVSVDSAQRITEFLMGKALNPSSLHQDGRFAKSVIEDARIDILRLLNVSVSEVNLTFTSSGTEANNWVINNFIDDEIFVSAIEHPSVLSPAKCAKKLTILPVLNTGLLDLEFLEKALSVASVSSRKLVSVMIANNETGIIQPINQIIEIARRYGAFVHSDCVQGFSKMRLDLKEMPIDFITISGHKCGAMQGVGALIFPKSFHLKPMLLGGGQERGTRSGTENVLAIESFAIEARDLQKNLGKRIEKMQNLRDLLEQNLILENKVIIVGRGEYRLPNTSFIINGKTDMNSAMQVIALDLAGVAVSAGSACSSGKISRSHVLEAMNIPENLIERGIRVSCSHMNKIDEIESFLTIYKQTIK